MPMFPDFENYVPNRTHPQARDLNTAGQMARMLNNVSGADVFTDVTGIHFRQRPIPAPPTELTAQYDGMVLQSGSDLVPAYGYLRLVNAPAT